MHFLVKEIKSKDLFLEVSQLLRKKLRYQFSLFF